ncbi:hypothetical protein ACFL05_00240 [Patescibacteria group bacterium]
MKKSISNTIYFLAIILVAVLLAWDLTFTPSGNTELVRNEIEKISNGKELPLNEFKTDGCSLWPDYILDYSWEDYCVKHDVRYWLGGTEEERLKADEELRDEVNSVLPGMGDVIYIGVRAGGRNLIPLIPFPWGWGYGWDSEREN